MSSVPREHAKEPGATATFTEVGLWRYIQILIRAAPELRNTAEMGRPAGILPARQAESAGISAYNPEKYSSGGST